MLLARTNFFLIGLRAKKPWEYAIHMHYHYSDIFYQHFFRKFTTMAAYENTEYKYLIEILDLGAA